MNFLSREQNFVCTIEDAVNHNLCMGCGICKSVCPNNAIIIELNHGEYRPKIDRLRCLGKNCSRCLKVCPGIGINFNSVTIDVFDNNLKVNSFIGKYYNLYSGFSCDKEIRYHSASGGMVTTFLIFLLDKKIIDGAVVTRYADDKITPLPFIAKTRKELIDARSSKYCPVSMENVRTLLSDVTGKYVLVGLPCHIQAFRKLAKIDRKFSEKVIGMFSIYCSSNRSFYARDYIFKTYNVKKSEISYFAFRDNGCLGNLSIDTGKNYKVSIPFTQYYSQLRSFFKPHRCLTCIDHYGELADISFGDIHIKPYSEDHIGVSSFIVRSSYWDDLIRQANSDGYITMNSLTPEILNSSQAEMLYSKKRKAKAVMNMDILLGRSIPNYDKELETPTLTDYIKGIVCHIQRYIGRKPKLWFIIKFLNNSK